MKRNRIQRGIAALIAAMTLHMLTPAPAHAWAAPVAMTASTDTLIFKNGNVLEGTIVSETGTHVRFKGELHGIAFETEYPKADILEIKRGTGQAAGQAATDTKVVDPSSYLTPPPAPVIDDGRDKIYWIDLTGKFGEEITQTPLRNALKDAKNQRADVIIVMVDNKVVDDEEIRGNEELEKLYAQFDELFRAEKIMAVVVDEVPAEWQKPPRIIYWVRRALGGIAFMPLTSKEVYFHPEGKLGGVGNLNGMRARGHRRVVEKQISLRRGHAVGWVNQSGFPQPEMLVRALTQEDFVLSLKIEGGRPVLFEGYPSNPGEELLTDDGMEGNADTIDQAARGEGNDVLTLDHRLAKLLGISKGTAETRDELLSLLGYRADQIVKSRSEAIMRDWVRGFEAGKTQARRLWEEFGEVQVQGDYDQRRQARSTQIQKIEQIKSIFKRYAESFEWRWLARYGFPIDGEGGPGIAQLTEIQDRIRTQQLLDRR
jgi:hypothetical protein